MKYDKDNDLLKPETFKEKIQDHTSDILFMLLLSFVVGVVVDARKQGYIPNNNIEQTQKQIPEVKQSTIYYNDTIRQNIR